MHNIYLMILVMALVTYFIRALPILLLRRQIRNRFINSFLYYVRYVTLSVMIFPDVLTSTGMLWSALAGFGTMLVLSFMKKNMFLVALASCLVVFLTETLVA